MGICSYNSTYYTSYRFCPKEFNQKVISLKRFNKYITLLSHGLIWSSLNFLKTNIYFKAITNNSNQAVYLRKLQCDISVFPPEDSSLGGSGYFPSLHKKSHHNNFCRYPHRAWYVLHTFLLFHTPSYAMSRFFCCFNLSFYMVRTIYRRPLSCEAFCWIIWASFVFLSSLSITNWKYKAWSPRFTWISMDSVFTWVGNMLMPFICFAAVL